MAVRRLRVVSFTDNGVRTPTPETAVAVERAAGALAAQGATVEWRVPPDTAEAWAAWDGLIRADGWAWLRRLITAPARRAWARTTRAAG